MPRLLRTFQCRHCGKDFGSRRKDPINCSPKCQQEASKRIFSADLIQEIIRLYESGLSQEQVGFQLGLTKSIIEKFFEQYKKDTGYKPRIPRKLNQTGSNNDSWKGGKTQISGYTAIRVPSHPRAKANSGYVFEHILIVEEYIGRYLIWERAKGADNEIVHHINGIRDDNRLENLVLMLAREHSYLHSNQKWAKKIRDATNDIIYSNLREASAAADLTENALATYIHFQWKRKGIIWQYSTERPTTALALEE